MGGGGGGEGKGGGVHGSVFNIDQQDGNHCQNIQKIYLRNGPCLACVYRVMDARRKLGEHEKKAFEWNEAKPSASLASQVLSQLPKCIHNSIDAQLKHGPFLLEHCHFKRKLIKYRTLLNHSERSD